MRLVMCLTLLVWSGCQKASDAAGDKQMPKLPPPPKVALPAELRIAVEIDGKEAPALDAARLNAVKPDFEDAERRAWRLATLVGPAAARPNAVAAVTGEKDMTVVMRQPRTDKDPMPVLTQSRRGGIVAAMVSQSDPFPPYHGQGRRLARPGDPLPRIDGVTKIRVYLDK
jgi:hypothetical protein